ncbi:MAG: transketolase [Thermodesulfobacteriota bacterium]|nr:transketolase [Thermodesulfobacteriota bacterium]
MTTETDELCVNTLRMLSADCVQKANSGHPGMPMGAAGMAYVLWTRFLKHNPRNPNWPDRDRFILSAGHGSALLYSLLHLTGYDLSLEDLKNFRQWNSKTPGHPEYSLTPGVETTTGPLGQGLANGVGMAITERFLATRFNRPGHDIVNHYTYGIVGDGDLMEGLSHEAASLAGHLGLGKLIFLYDDNRICIEGSTDRTFTEDRAARFEAYGWHVQKVGDGNDLEAIEKAIATAQGVTDQPSLISVRTHIGYGSPNKQDTASAHGEPLGDDEIKITKINLRWPEEPSFFIPEKALHQFRRSIDHGEEVEGKWQERFQAFEKTFPELATVMRDQVNGKLPEAFSRDVPIFPSDAKGMATRAASGKVLNSLAKNVPQLMGGSADLAPSNKTLIEGEKDFEIDTYEGRNLRFGVREHGMGAILNGMALHGGVIPYGGTFLVFSDYMRPAIRLAALMRLQVIYVFTHDSIGVGEDGPTHQPVEHLSSLRSIPNLTVVRPCDANEAAEAWHVALKSKNGPVALILTRQGLPVLDRTTCAPASMLEKGAYILKESNPSKTDLILIASGSEVPIAMSAAEKLEEMGQNIRIVSMPSWELFEKQPEQYRNQVLPPEIRLRIAIEAGVTDGWCRYVGDKGVIVGIDHFGSSAPAKVLFEKFGITDHQVIERASVMLGLKP